MVSMLNLSCFKQEYYHQTDLIPKTNQGTLNFNWVIKWYKIMQ